MSEYGALDAHIKNAELLVPKSFLEKSKTSAVQATKIPMLNKYAASTISSRACTITGQASTSALQTVSYQTLGFEVKITEAINAANYISAQDEFANQYAMGMKAVLAALDTLAIANFETNKSAVLAAAGGLASVEAGAYKVTKANYDAKKLYSIVPSLMAVNDIYGGLIDVTNATELTYMLEHRTLGQNNSVNVAGLINGGLDGAGNFQNYITNRLDIGLNQAIHYLAPVGSIGMYTYIDWEARNNSMLHEGDKKYTMQDNIYGITWGVHQKRACVDDNTFGSVYSDVYAFTCDFAFLNQYSSDTSSSIIKVTVPTSDL